VDSLLTQQVANGLVLACVYALFALGLSVTWGVLKVLNLAHAHLFTVGALVAIWLSRETGLPVPLVAIVAAIAAGAVALVVDSVAFYPLRRRNLGVEDMEIASLITSLGASMILLSLASRWTGGTAQSFAPDFVSVRNFEVLGVRVTSLQLVVAATAVLFTIAAWAVVRRTQFGRGLRAMAFSMDIARMVGVRAESSYRATLFVCGALAGVAGVLLALLLGSVDAFTGETLLIKGIAIIVLAGSGQILGLLVGGLLLGLGETVGSIWLPAPALASLPFLLIVVVLLIRPAGLFARVDTVRA
jgi:branched-chain amino acid transport system permease protein